MTDMDEDAGNSTKNSKRVVGTPFPKGVSGNPNGRPKGPTVWTEFLKLLKTKDENGNTNAKAVALSLLRECKERGNPVLLKEIIERQEGKIPQAMEHSGPNGEAINVSHTLDKDAILALADSFRDNER
jgi:hypothetical protein